MAQNNSKVVNILLADDHHLVRDGIKSLIEKYKEFKVVGEGADGSAIMQILETTEEKIDLVLADINMPNMGGLELVEKIVAQYPSIKVLMLSMLDHEKYVSQALQVGAKGYLLKSVNEEELVFALKRVMSTSFYICSELTYQLLRKNLLGTNSVSRNKMVNHVQVEFSSKEIEILALIADGFTNIEIAEKLFTSKRTVEGHRLQMIAKTGVRNTAALIKYCFNHGVLNDV